MMLGGTIFCQIFSRVVMLEITYKKNQRCSDGFVSFRMNNWLVVWNMAFINAFKTFHSVGNVIIPTDELIFFRGVETTNQK